MQSRAIRQSFIDFFVERGHRHVPSSPLVPHGDPTLLFTNAGMVQFKDAFLGREKLGFTRAVTSQKCLRVSGKHNDLENVGPSPRHHTFFEMLGNFSFGDYFKAEAIELAWELVTGPWGLAPDTLSVTVFEEDDEAAELWQRIAGLSAERIHRCDATDNFWAMGETGPCGPCSEIHVDRFPERPQVPWEEGSGSGRYVEIWNLVFMQYDRDASGTLVPLPNPSIDTGAGLERVAAVLQAKESNYDTDLFTPILEAVGTLCGQAYDGGDDARAVAMRVIADHLRAVTFLLADGVIPANEGRGYVLRRILRRAVRHGMELGFEEPFMHRLVPVLEEALGDAYPELGQAREATMASVRVEEERFLDTLASGARQVQQAVAEARAQGRSEIPGEAVFFLYDTHGLPLEIIEEIAEEERIGLDRTGFEAALEEQRRRSRSAGGGAQQRLAGWRDALAAEGSRPTDFVGYDELEHPGAAVARLAGERDGRPVAVTRLERGQPGVVVLDATPFYAEAGGQVGDVGTLEWSGGLARVTDVQKDLGGIFYHFVEVAEGSLPHDQAVTARVEASVRRDTERNHTATHLLHAALRRVLGEGVRQAGSLVHPQRLRFDFTFARPLSEVEVLRVEDLVNDWIRWAVSTRIAVEGYGEALSRGAVALFGEKYGERVRTVEIPGVSTELCGGNHVRNTGEIALFLVTSERAVASGVRRIEAVTGAGALARIRERGRRLAEVEGALGVPAERVVPELEALRVRVKELERELAKLRRKMVAGEAAAARDVAEVDGIKVMAREVPPAPAEELRQMVDVLRQKLGSGVVVLGSRGDGKVSLIAAVTSDLTGRLHAGELVRAVAKMVGGGGGGRPDLAQAGGRLPEKLEEALRGVEAEVARQLRQGVEA
jgi:alanyl-tRNA synthetase